MTVLGPPHKRGPGRARRPRALGWQAPVLVAVAVAGAGVTASTAAMGAAAAKGPGVAGQSQAHSISLSLKKGDGQVTTEVLESSTLSAEVAPIAPGVNQGRGKMEMAAAGTIAVGPQSAGELLVQTLQGTSYSSGLVSVVPPRGKLVTYSFDKPFIRAHIVSTGSAGDLVDVEISFAPPVVIGPTTTTTTSTSTTTTTMATTSTTYTAPPPPPPPTETSAPAETSTSMPG